MAIWRRAQSSFSNALKDLQESISLCIGKDHQKLLTSPANQLVALTETLPENLGCVSNNLVTDVMTKGIVDLLEVVDVSEGDRQWQIGA